MRPPLAAPLRHRGPSRPGRPHRTPTRTPPRTRVLDHRRTHRQGPARISAATGAPARTVSRIPARHHRPRPAECDPLTGTLIRATRTTRVRYEHPRPGDLVHLDVKKPGRIPQGGGWRAHGRSGQVRGRGIGYGIGYDSVHAAVDDHSRLAYAEVLPDEKGATRAGFLGRAAAYFARAGIETITRVIPDNALAYRNSRDFAAAVAALGARHKFIKARCPWHNGKVERFNRTLATEWTSQRVFTSNTQRTRALAPWLEQYNTTRPHTALGGQPPTSRLSPT